MKKINEIPKLNKSEIPKVNINEIPKINLDVIQKTSNIKFYTQRNNKDNNIIKPKETSLISYKEFPPKITTSLLTDENNSPNKTFKINIKTNTPVSFLWNNNILSSYKILDMNDFAFTERLKTSSTRYSGKTFTKDKLKNLSKKAEKRRTKLKKKDKNYGSLIKIQKDKINEVTFIPSPFLLNTSKIINKNVINTFKIGKSQKSKDNIKNDDNNNINIKDDNLPIFLRHKYNIKGTNIISPFCIKARDESLYKRIFYNYFKKPINNKKKGVDNKLNIIYAENEEKFKKKIKNINEKIKKEGKKEKNAQFPNSLANKLANMEKKIKFMKKIVDYAYPEMVLTRVREANKILEYTRKNNKKFIPYKSADYKIQQYNRVLTKELLKSFNFQTYHLIE